MKAGVFLDRDGVLIEDVHLLVNPADIRILSGVVAALRALHDAGYGLVVVSNQPVVARGLISEAGVRAVHKAMGQLLEKAGAPSLDGCYFCPHHPRAELPEYSAVCECRKPQPGLLRRAALEHDLDLTRSFMVGDRITDIIAGARAGTRTVLVQTGRHLDQPIETGEPLDTAIRPDYTCADLREAAQWILKRP